MREKEEMPYVNIYNCIYLPVSTYLHLPYLHR